LKKTQYVCAMFVTMLQVALCPFENLQTWSSSSPSPDYLGQDLKLQHLKWLVDNILTAPRNHLAAHLGSYDGDEELWATRAVSATQIFVDKWFPHGSPQVPEVEQCVRLADDLPFTHSVSGAEERTALGLPSAAYSSDVFKIFNLKAPIPIPGSGTTFTFVLPHLNATGTEAWTQTPRFHLHDIDKSDQVAASIWKREFFQVVDSWNIARVVDSPFPPKDPSASLAFRDDGAWAGKVQSPKLLAIAKSQQTRESSKKEDRLVLRSDKKEHWPDILDTGRKYQVPCQATRATLPD
jgi:hypothetical protein